MIGAVGLIVVKGGAGVAAADDEGLPEVISESLHPHQPGNVQDEVADVVAVVLSVVAVVVEGSLHPNQPGVSHVEVEVMAMLVVMDGRPVVDGGSRQPHQPGVLHVSVLVCVKDVVEALELVVVLELLLSKYFQSKQSQQSTMGLHSATLSYASMTWCKVTVIR